MCKNEQYRSLTFNVYYYVIQYIKVISCSSRVFEAETLIQANFVKMLNIYSDIYMNYILFNIF